MLHGAASLLCLSLSFILSFQDRIRAMSREQYEVCEVMVMTACAFVLS